MSIVDPTNGTTCRCTSRKSRRKLGWTRLSISSDDEAVPVLPSGFLVGSAPRLQKVRLSGVPFPALPTLLWSASDLVELELHKLELPLTGYISPEGMAAGLATLTRLRSLHIRFRSPASFPDGICLPPVTRAVLPALTAFEFEGVSNYLEDLVARLDCPRPRSSTCINALALAFKFPNFSSSSIAQKTPG